MTFKERDLYILFTFLSTWIVNRNSQVILFALVGVALLPIALSVYRRREAIGQKVRSVCLALAGVAVTFWIGRQFTTDGVKILLVALLVEVVVLHRTAPRRRSRYIPRIERRKVIARYERSGRHFDPRLHHIDHIIPYSRGGSNKADNLRVVDRDLNLAKSDKLPWWDIFGSGAFFPAVMLLLILFGLFVHNSFFQRPKVATAAPKTAFESDIRNNGVQDNGTVQKLAPEEPQPQPQLRRVNIGNGAGAFTVAAQRDVFYTLVVPPGVNNATVHGHFQAMGGIGNDIEVLLLNPEELTNWRNGQATPTYYYSRGKVTVGDVQAVLPTGTYYLVFSNRFSPFAKTVQFNGAMTYLTY